MDLYEYRGKTYTKQEFIQSLYPYIHPGDTLALEIDTMRFGKIHPGLTKVTFLQTIFQIFIELVGPKGNLIIPTFSYSWGLDSPEKHFDVQHTPSKVGLFPEYFRQRADTIRTLDPMFSFALWGPNKEKLSQTSNQSFGKGSLYEKLHQLNAKLVSFGLKKHDPTFIHYIEQYFHENIQPLDYRFIKEFTGTLIAYQGEPRLHNQFCFSRYLDRYTDHEFDENKLNQDLKKENKVITLKIGQGEISISDCQSTFQIGLAGMKRDPHYFLRKKETLI